ncbi:LysE/ArgO family amino acid transporter [Castellaniella sp.]|uniref:LysE/ArgO family amino acid transporter n=1 Tax=Castellaniella sp. TaxID=1955812 RepID=UPI002AFF8454|nr:LysE/ArgO family amino acid transporter [Castellaniella sp.]
MNGFISGFFLGLGLIAAIGAQNAFVLKQGLQKRHVLAVSLTCALSDTLLIMAGVAGFGALIAAAPGIQTIMSRAGALFLAAYAIKSFWAAITNRSALNPAQTGTSSLSATVTTCLAFTWLNPHVYLDTVVLLGSVSTNYGPDRYRFGLGAITASFLFFFALGFGARLLRPLFARPVAWRVLDLLVGLIMTLLAVKLMASG